MAVRFQCPSCRYGADVPDEYSGRTLKCPQCASPGPAGANGPAGEAGMRSCPFCAESVKPAARKCRHCGEILDRQLAIAKQQERMREIEKRRLLVITEVPGSRAAFICGVLSILSAPGLVLGVLLGSVAVLLGAAAVKESRKYPELEGLQRARLAIILGVIGIIASLIVLALILPGMLKK